MNGPPAPAPQPWPWREGGLLALWLFATLGWRPLLLPDEGRYAGVAWEMLRRGGWAAALVPTLDGLPFFHKPPLLYWLDMAAMRALGVDVYAARCGPALLGWVLAMALFLHLRRWHGVAVARIGAAVLATSPLFYVGAQYVNHDIGVAACIGAAVLAAVRAVDDPARVARRWLVVAWVLCGLGVLAKGLIGIVLPVAVLLPWLAAQHRWRTLLGLLHPLGLLAFAAVVLPWMVAMQLRYPGFYDYFIVEQHFRRYTGGSFNNRMPFWFFVVVLPLFMLPWSLWVWPALRRAWPPDVRHGLYLWWLAVIVGFFSLPASKLVGYVLPAAPPLAALLALAIAERGSDWRRVAGAAALACVLIVGVVAWKAPGSHRELALTLGRDLRPGDRVVFVDAYDYDVPFYARLAEPVVVVADWDAPDLALHDNWRKELYDAARFAPDRGASVLWPWRRLDALACHSGAVWVLAGSAQRPRLAQWPGLALVRAVRGVELLRAPGMPCRAAP